MDFKPSELKIGILGGGQLGKMLILESAKLNVNFQFLDPDPQAPCFSISPHGCLGDFKKYDDVLRFANNLDILSIEIEDVHCEALIDANKKYGTKIYPQAEIIQLIKNKFDQKNFYLKNNIPTAPCYDLNEEVKTKEAFAIFLLERNMTLPVVQKLHTGGYDGKGVYIIQELKDFEHRLIGRSFIEVKADIDTEISVIVVRSTTGEIVVYPPVSMDFHPEANLVEYLVCPAKIPDSVSEQCIAIAQHLVEKLDIIGILAVEMFYNKDGTIWINEIAPRTHNSGHHTLDNGATSQFENHMRAIIGLPLGHTHYLTNAIMINILGEKDYQGPAIYQGLNECLEIEGVHIHLYGKAITKAYRKMGHVTIIGPNYDSCIQKANFVKKTLKVIA